MGVAVMSPLRVLSSIGRSSKDFDANLSGTYNQEDEK
jgi:hypothetical protein